MVLVFMLLPVPTGYHGQLCDRDRSIEPHSVRKPWCETADRASCTSPSFQVDRVARKV